MEGSKNFNGWQKEAIRLLLVEDNFADAFYFKEIIGENPDVAVTISQAGSLTQARAILQNAPQIDLICLDLGLPDARGEEVLRGIEAVNPRIPIVIMSGSEDHRIEAWLREGRFSARIHKDKLTLELFLETLAQVLDRQVLA